MAVQRDRPYSQFNFLVDLGGGDVDGPDAGFQECSPIASEVAVIDPATATTRATRSTS
jgi:hypothetical protein